MGKFKELIFWVFIISFFTFSFLKLSMVLKKQQDLTKLYKRPYEESIKLSLKINDKKLKSLTLLDAKTHELENCFSDSKNAYFLILIISENSCNPCSKKAIRYCNDLFATKIKEIYCILNIRGKFERKRFIKINKIKFKVYLDPYNKFMTQLGIVQTPCLLLINKTNIIVESLFLKPQLENISKLYFDYFNKRLDQNYKYF